MRVAAFLAIALVGCAHQSLNEPSGTGVNSAVGRTQTNVEQARKYNDLAVTQNAQAQTNVERIDAKARVIQKFWGK